MTAMLTVRLLDESFAGPSLALYSFVPENSNELALREGQIIQVGYRHGQGWLVAMDMDSGEQGLVPEEYVRLLSEIEGWGEHLEGVEEEETETETETEATGFDQGEEDEEESSSGLVVVVGDHDDDDEGERVEGKGVVHGKDDDAVAAATTSAQSTSSNPKASSSDKEMLGTG
jgi:co-chaperonin GroES (HSP10)